MELYVLEFHAAWDLVEPICYFLFLSAFGKPRGKRFWAVPAMLAVWILLRLNQNRDFVNGILYWILPMVLSLAASWPLYRERWDLRLLAGVSCYLLLGVMENTAVYGVSWAMGWSFGDLTYSSAFYLLTVSASKAAALVLSCLIHSMIRRRDFHTVTVKWVLLAILFPAISAVMTTILYFYYMNSHRGTGPAALFSALLGLANGAVLYMVFAIQRSIRQEQEMELLRQQISLQKTGFESLEASYRTQRKASHDFEHHLQVLSDLMDTGETDTARDYLRQLRKNRALQVFSVQSRHPVIDVILNQKYQLAQSLDVQMHIEVNDLSPVTVPADTLVVVLSNLLDNALEACAQLEHDRQILCRILAGETLFLSVRNPSQPVLIEETGAIRTSKACQRDHGYGLPAVRYVLDEIGAEYTCAYRDGWFQFAAEIPMRN